jgi:hypothetical protein
LTSNYEMFYRGYDPSIGRMSGVDVMADSYSSLTPYNYSFNDPVYWNDPNGDCPDCQYQRSDDTWWVAPRGTRGKYEGFETFANWAYQNQGRVPNIDPFGALHLDYGQMYGDGPNAFGPGYVPGIYGGSARLDQEGWLPEWSIKYTEYEDGVTRVNSVRLLGFVRTGSPGNEGGGRPQDQGQGNEVMPTYSLLYHSPELDIFAEILVFTSPSKTVERQNIFYVQFGKNNKVENSGGIQKTITNGEVKYSKLYISPGLEEFVENVESSRYHETVIEKWWDYLWSPVDHKRHNSNVSTGVHR